MFRCAAIIVSLLLCCVPLVSAESGAPDTAAQSQQTLLSFLPNPLPSPASAQRPPDFYTPEKLFEYMDGASDAFLMYDVKMLLHEDVKANNVDISLDIFDMGAPENAFGMYASERTPQFHYIAIGTEGYHNSEGSLNFLQGRYYVKLTAFGEGTDTVLRQIADAISSKIGEKTGLPALVAQLPQGHLKTKSEQYLRKDPMGHPFLAPAFMALYSFGEQETTLLVSVAADEADAQQRLKALDKHFRDTGKCETAPELGGDAIRASNSFEGKVIARTKGRYVIALYNPAEGAQEVLKEAVERLK